jgi:uncharacterized protein (TIGR03067 family)
LRVAKALLPAAFVIGCSWHPPPADPLPTPGPTGWPSSEAVEAITGFPREAFDGPLGRVELDRLAGTWVVVRQEWPAGVGFDEADLIRFRRVAFDGPRCQFTFTPARGQPDSTGVLTAVPAPFCDPKGLDLVDENGGVRCRCLYKLADGELTAALGLHPQNRPTGFRPKLLPPEDAFPLLVLRRE